VEDERAIRDLLRIHLQNAGYETIVAADAVDAGRLFLEAADGFDLIIVDAQLPYMNGIEFASALIADTTLPAVPIILITGHERFVMRAAVLDVPCLVKPFSVDDLVSLVEKTLGAATVAAAGVRANRAAVAKSESR
jgi:two-component system phosphate regulon response regulator PhoB